MYFIPLCVWCQLYFIISLSINNVYSFNLETRIPIIKQEAIGSYFGYSVAEHITESIDGISWLLVGAPLGQNRQPDTNRSGALWKCPLTTRLDDCQQVVTDGKRSIESDALRPPLKDEIKDDQWLGVTVKSQGPGGKVVVCAHRYIRKSGESRYGQGLCYTLKKELNYDMSWEPCKGRPTGREHEEYGYCQAGTSSSYLEDGTMVLGSPGSYTWKGTLFVIDTNDNYLQRDKQIYYGPVTRDLSPVDKYSYIGMSVAGGRFFGKYMSFASGAPRSQGTGQVVIFSKNIGEMHSRNPINVSLVIDGEQFASNFGYEIATADLNGDGISDLAIGAPFYFSRDSGGAVYIYINENYSFGSNYTVKLVGKIESRFGFAIANAGDLNKDGCDDLAIGSPYDGNGVVFIYLGNKIQGIDKEPKQIISAEMLPKLLKTFGYSLSGGLDMDGNGYPDLLVGAYEQDSVVLLRGRPIIDIKTFVKENETLKNIDPSKIGCPMDPEANHTCFSFETCCTIDSLVKPTSTESLTLNYTIEAETYASTKKFSRVYFGGTPGKIKSNIVKKNIELSRDNRLHCQSHTVYIKENTRDIQSPIMFHVAYNLVQKTPKWSSHGPLPSVESFPVLNATQATQVFQAGLLRYCGTDDICTSDITIDASLELPRSDKGEFTLTLGTEDEVRLSVRVDNMAEAAYEAHLFISHHPGLNYIAANLTDKHVICNLSNKTLVICSLGNPFNKQPANASPIVLRFDPKSVDDVEQSVEFSVWTNSTSQELHKKKPTQVKASVVKNAELTIKGSARPEQVFYGGVDKGESAMTYLDDIGSRVLHTYQVYNLGPWRVNSVEVVIEWPHQVANNKPQGKWLLYPEGLPTVESEGGGECYISAKHINPLKLQPRPGVEEPPLENLIRLDPMLTSPKPLWNPTQQNNDTEELRTEQLRTKRNVEMVVKPEAYTDSDGMRHQTVNMNCQQGTAKCLTITCAIFKLHRNQEATIRIRARLWNASLVEDYPRVARVVVSSKATLRLPKHYNIHQNNMNDDEDTVNTIAYPDLASVEVSDVPMYIIFIAIFLGIIVLILLILALWKLGFFKRRRPDPTLSGNIEKSHEETAFLPK